MYIILNEYRVRVMYNGYTIILNNMYKQNEIKKLKKILFFCNIRSFKSEAYSMMYIPGDIIYEIPHDKEKIFTDFIEQTLPYPNNRE